ncbi:MAG: hypothetical protein ACKO8I_19730, partial [Cyanobacteriota bacterium]
RQGEQHGINQPALELPYPPRRAQERQVQLHLPAVLWRQEMGMEGIHSQAQGLPDGRKPLAQG